MLRARLILLCFFVCLFYWAMPAQAADEFQSLARNLPRATNAIVLLNVKKAMESPLGIYEGWSRNLEKAFNAGITRVPPESQRFVLGAELDFEFMKPIWEAAVVETVSPIDLQRIAEKRGGRTDTVETLSAVALPEDAYLVQFDERELAGIGPANRKLVVNWLRDRRESQAPSEYILQAAAYSDKSGSEIILAMDLYGAFSLEEIVTYLKRKPAVTEGDVNIQKAAQLLASVQGIRMGIRLTNPPSAALAIDCQQACGLEPSAAKDALLQTLADGGLLLEEMRDWDCAIKDREVSLTGKLSKAGLRRVLSLVDSPTTSVATSELQTTESPKSISSTAPQSQQSISSQQHFQAVLEMFEDLQKDLKTIDNLNVNATYFDRYAKRIERLPILNVDPELLDYSAYIAQELRLAAGSVRTMGIRGGARQAQIDQSDVQYNYAYGYRSGWYGSTGWAAPITDGVSEYKAVAQERRKIRAEEKGVTARDVHKIRADIIDATAKIRRQMTQKYQIEF